MAIYRETSATVTADPFFTLHQTKLQLTYSPCMHILHFTLYCIPVVVGNFLILHKLPACHMHVYICTSTQHVGMVYRQFLIIYWRSSEPNYFYIISFQWLQHDIYKRCFVSTGLASGHCIQQDRSVFYIMCWWMCFCEKCFGKINWLSKMAYIWHIEEWDRKVVEKIRKRFCWEVTWCRDSLIDKAFTSLEDSDQVHSGAGLVHIHVWV